MIQPSPELCAQVQELLSHTASSKDLSWHSMSPSITVLLYIEGDYPCEFFSHYVSYLHSNTDVNSEIPMSHSFFSNTAFIPHYSVLLLTCIRIHLHRNTREKLCFSSCCKDFIFIRVTTLCDICIHLLLCADQVCCLLESWMFVNRAQGGRMLWLPCSLSKAENAPHRHMLLFLRSIWYKWNNETRG